MVEEGLVIRQENGKALIQITNPVACEKCGLCPVTDKGVLEWSDENLKEGNRVKIEIPDSFLVRSALCLYLIPTGAFLLGLGLAYAIIPTVGFSLGGGLIFVMGSVIFLRFLGSKRKVSAPFLIIQLTSKEGDDDAGEDRICSG